MILSTSLEFNPSLNVASRDCIAALSGLAAGLSAATALAEARMAAQNAVTVRMLIPAQISAISVIRISRIECGREEGCYHSRIHRTKPTRSAKETFNGPAERPRATS